MGVTGGGVAGPTSWPARRHSVSSSTARLKIIADGPSHTFRNVPHIIAGSGGGYLKQGAFVDAANSTNNKLFNSLIRAAVRDKLAWTENFGNGTGSGELDVVLA